MSVFGVLFGIDVMLCVTSLSKVIMGLLAGRATVQTMLLQCVGVVALFAVLGGSLRLKALGRRRSAHALLLVLALLPAAVFAMLAAVMITAANFQ